MGLSLETFEKTEEKVALDQFRIQNPDLFRKEDSKLFLHLGMILLLLSLSTAFVVLTDQLVLKIFLGAWNALLWFSLINVTIHHHHTHHNAAEHPFSKKFLDLLYLVAVPNASKRRNRYTRVHLNHHARPFHETDVDHHYGKNRYLQMTKTLRTRVIYFLELTFIGG